MAPDTGHRFLRFRRICEFPIAGPEGVVHRMMCGFLLVLVWLGTGSAVMEAGDAADLRQLEHEMTQAFSAKDYVSAEKACRTLLARTPDDPSIAYNLSCALARRGHTADALSALTMACEHGYGDADHASTDEDLASLRTSDRFTSLLAKMRTQAYTGGAAYESGEDIPGVRTIENFPGAGLHYRIRLGEHASSTHRHRLIVWLHPSGGSADRLVEQLAPSLADKGFCLMVFTQKPYGGWDSTELTRIAPSILDAAGNDGIDARHPLLMGFSAGGQAALQLWCDAPHAYAGLILDAAYPIDLGRGIAAEAVMGLTPDALASKTPMYAVIGDKDGGLRIWNKALPVWSKAGLPVTLVTVPGHGHEYLLAGEVWQGVLGWLAALPADPHPIPVPKRH